MIFKGLALERMGKIGGKFGMEIESGESITGREILLYGLRKFRKPAALTVYILSLYSLMFPQDLYIPFYPWANKQARRWFGFYTELKKEELIKTVRLEETIEEKSVYKYLRKITRESGEEWKKIQERIKELAEVTGANLNEISTYTSIPEKRVDKIISGETPPTNREVDELEKFFGERIIFRRKKINMKSDPRVFSILHDYQEKIVDGLKTSPKGEAFVQKYQLKPQQEIEFKSKSPLEIVEESIITVPCILSYAIKPVYPNDIRSELGVRNISEIISCLSSYGILNEENGKYYTSSIEFFEKSLKRLYRQAEKYKLYIKVQNLKKDLLFKGVVDVLGLSIPTIYSWIDGSYKPRPLPLHSVELLLRRGLISEKEFEDFKRYGLVRTVSI